MTAVTPVNFGTNEHPHKAAIILITYCAIDCYADFNSPSNMLTPIKNQGDEHICILPQTYIINCISIYYIVIHRLLRMLIGSEWYG